MVKILIWKISNKKKKKEISGKHQRLRDSAEKNRYMKFDQKYSHFLLQKFQPHAFFKQRIDEKCITQEATRHLELIL